MQEVREAAKQIVRKYFKNDYGEPFEMTDGQADIFNLIWLKMHPRNALLAYTQYGKTDVVSMALILRSQIYKEPFTIVAGKKGKGMLIMNKVLQHAFDHPLFYSKLEIDKNFPLERLKRERSKEKINWLGGGEIRILSAQTGNRNQLKEALIGEGGQNIILEEAPHISDDVFAMVMRMLMGHKDNFLLKIGNAFYRNHYFRSMHSEKYKKLTIDYHQGIAEGRIVEEQIEEVRDLPFFKELYECRFPEKDEYTVGGYKQLITEETLQAAYIDPQEAEELKEGDKRLGADFAGGGNDRSAYVLRSDKVMWIEKVNSIADTMQQVPIVEDLVEEYEIEDEDVALDYGGLGQGIGDRLGELEYDFNLVQFGAGAPEPIKHKNMRAYMYYELAAWIRKGGRIVKDDRWQELLYINYKADSEKKFQIEAKEDLKKRLKEEGIHISSPDIADAAALTFAGADDVVTDDDYGVV